MNNKDYRDKILNYVQKLGEIDRAEDQLTELKKEADNLKKKINDAKRKKTNE